MHGYVRQSCNEIYKASFKQSKQHQLLLYIGIGLSVLGLICLFICIPTWIWLSLFGLVCLTVGVLLLRLYFCPGVKS